MRFALLAAVVFVGYAVWQKHGERMEASAISNITDANGFIEMDIPSGGRRDQVMIVAAENCPHAAAQHADALAREMAQRNLSFVRTSTISFTPPPNFDDTYIRRHNEIMNREPPLVFVNGRVKSNPSLTEVLDEYAQASTP